MHCKRRLLPVQVPGVTREALGEEFREAHDRAAQTVQRSREHEGAHANGHASHTVAFPPTVGNVEILGIQFLGCSAN